MKSPSFTKEGKIMDRKEIKAKIMKALTIALPILLVAILAMLIVVAMNVSDENYVPVFNYDDGMASTTTSGKLTTTKGNEETPDEPDDDPVDDPSSEGLSFTRSEEHTSELQSL